MNEHTGRPPDDNGEVEALFRRALRVKAEELELGERSQDSGAYRMNASPRRTLGRASVLVSAAAVLATVGIVSVTMWLAGGNDGETISVASRGDSPTDGAVPWLNRTAVPHSTTEPTEDPCSQKDIRVVDEGGQPLQGIPVQALGLQNTGSSPCTLDGAPRTTITDADGGEHDVAVGEFADRAVTLSPSETADVLIGADVQGCPRGADGPLSAFVRVFIGDGSQEVPSGAIDLLCNEPRVLDFEGRSDSPSHDPIASLDVSVEASGAAVVGEQFTYVVTLGNGTDHDIPLTPCPTYTESVNGDGNSYLLNCEDARVVPAGATLTFEMQINIPDDAVLGPAKLGWQLNVYGGQADVSVIDIEQ